MESQLACSKVYKQILFFFSVSSVKLGIYMSECLVLQSLTKVEDMKIRLTCHILLGGRLIIAKESVRGIV